MLGEFVLQLVLLIVPRSFHRVLHNDRSHQIHQHHTDEGDVGIEVQPSIRQEMDKLPNIGVEGIAQHDLDQCKHHPVDAPKNPKKGVDSAELLDVRHANPLTLQRHNNNRQAEDGKTVCDEEDHNDSPKQRSARVRHTTDQHPSLAKDGHVAEDAHKSSEPDCPQHAEDADDLALLEAGDPTEEGDDPSENQPCDDHEAQVQAIDAPLHRIGVEPHEAANLEAQYDLEKKEDGEEVL
mmetsp:Transcript_88820/g.250617  ORF Transcript_88820/g.250617 Transcript_88820/m.250617 type:complete len:237 (-) Transcript_88820:937-1647(-)